jgi:hypothetical protein
MGNFLRVGHMQSAATNRVSSFASSYKHDCDCFEFLNTHLKITGIVGIVQQYLHMIDAEYLKSKLKMPITLRYASRDDYLFQWGLRQFSGKIVYPYNSAAHVSLDLNIAAVAKNQIRATISVQFSHLLCAEFGAPGISNKMLKFAMNVGSDNVDMFVNTLLIQDHRPQFLCMLLDGCKSLKSHEDEIRKMIAQPVFEQGCAMLHRRLTRAIYSEYHVDVSYTAACEEHYDIPSF